MTKLAKEISKLKKKETKGFKMKKTTYMAEHKRESVNENLLIFSNNTGTPVKGFDVGYIVEQVTAAAARGETLDPKTLVNTAITKKSSIRVTYPSNFVGVDNPNELGETTDNIVSQCYSRDVSDENVARNWEVLRGKLQDQGLKVVGGKLKPTRDR